MISAVFVDRPRLAIVIAFVITIAGALALLQIPVAQFPDIVPPQVTVTGDFPGASAEVVETSVAQPLEAADRRRRQDALHEVDQRQRRQLHADRLVRARHQSRHRHRQRQQPRADRAVAIAARSAAAGPGGAEEVFGDAAVHRALQRQWRSRIRCSSPTTPSSTCSTRFRVRPASDRPTCSAS